MSNRSITTDRRAAPTPGSEAHAVRTAHPPSPPGIAQSLENRSARTSLPDRVAMWIGLKLLLWGTRPVRGQATTRDLHEWRMERELRERQLELDRTRAAVGFYAYGGQFGR